MSKISDELRLIGRTEYYPGSKTYNQLFALSDRIDAEMVELPRGKDGKPIRVGETVYGEDGRTWHVKGITIGENQFSWKDYTVHVMNDTDGWCDFRSERLTHTRPDSWERIAQELEDMSEDFRMTDQESFSALLDFADRIRRLAEEREHERE